MAVDSGMTQQDRRRAERTLAVLAVALDSPEKQGRHGVTRDVSESGLLVVTPSAFRLGDRVQVTVHAGGEDRAAAGRVARIDENPVSSPELWRWRVGIALDEPLPRDFVEKGAKVSARFKTSRA